MFAEIGRMDADAWGENVAEDVTIRFGKDEPMQGRQACRAAPASFYNMIAGVPHDIVELCEQATATIAESNVIYPHKDGGSVTVPCVTTYRTYGGDLIEDYPVFIDIAAVVA